MHEVTDEPVDVGTNARNNSRQHVEVVPVGSVCIGRETDNVAVCTTVSLSWTRNTGFTHTQSKCTEHRI